MSADPDCLFCGVAAGNVPADVVVRTERVVAFHDINPQAPLHVLVVPVEHHPDLTALASADPQLLGEVAAAAARIAQDSQHAKGQYRLVFNTGAAVGQSVFHVHAHVLGGRPMGWPPG